jgi:hypothetical protein
MLLTHSEPRSGINWTHNRRACQRRELKHRAQLHRLSESPISPPILLSQLTKRAETRLRYTGLREARSFVR